MSKSITLKHPLIRMSTGDYCNIYRSSNKYIVKKYDSYNDMTFVTFQREIATLKAINHPNIIKILKIEPNFSIILPLYPFNATFLIRTTCIIKYPAKSQSCLDRVYEIDGISISFKDMIHKLTSTLDYLHSCGFIHGDLKLDNVLINEQGEPILIDFGCSNQLPLQETTEFAAIYSVTHRSPEAAFQSASKKNIGYSSDIWALALIIIEIYYKSRLFYFSDRQLCFNDNILCAAIYVALNDGNESVLKLIPDIPQRISKDLPIQLQPCATLNQINKDQLNIALPIVAMLSINPELRPSTGKILEWMNVGFGKPLPTKMERLDKYDIISPLKSICLDIKLRNDGILLLITISNRLKLSKEAIFYALILLDCIGEHLTSANINNYVAVCLRIAEEYRELAYHILKPYRYICGVISLDLFNSMRSTVYAAIDHTFCFSTGYDYYNESDTKSPDTIVFMICALMLSKQELLLANIDSQKELFNRSNALAEKLKSNNTLFDDFETRVIHTANNNQFIYFFLGLNQSD